MPATYEVRTVSSAAELSDAPLAELSSFYPVGNGYEPRTTAALVYVPGEGFYARMRCYETAPKAEETREDGDVYKDSCLECFLNFNPEQGEEYLNLEANARGTLHCRFGRDRYVRRSLAELGVGPRPVAVSRVLPDCWEMDYFVSVALVEALFHKSSFAPGDRLRGNFYKCGDETAFPHFGMWNPVQGELNFHQPAFFGDLIITE
ncbi:MAG: carbohydrate-binding family 9-like protein [Oscillospiraceae bacterium]|nr:carbohydrate-binding family 9-like protein [Oscillospiraceae bacterium]